MTIKVDPEASMRCWAITVMLGGREYEIPALPAIDWWPVLVEADLSLILDFVTSSIDLDDLLLAGEVDSADLAQVLTEAVEEAAGRSFHAAFCLATVATSSWSAIGGQLALAGFRWDVAPLGAALDAVFSVIVDSIPAKDDRDKFLALLEKDSLTGGKRKIDRKKALAEFAAFAGPPPTAGVPATAVPSGNERPRTRRQPRPPRQDVP